MQLIGKAHGSWVWQDSLSTISKAKQNAWSKEWTLKPRSTKACWPQFVFTASKSKAGYQQELLDNELELAESNTRPAREKQGALMLSLSISRHNHLDITSKTMTGTTAKAHLIDLLLEPLRGCSGLYTYRQQLMKKVMKMPAVEVKERLKHLYRIHFPGTWVLSPS